MKAVRITKSTDRKDLTKNKNKHQTNMRMTISNIRGEKRSQENRSETEEWLQRKEKTGMV